MGDNVLHLVVAVNEKRAAYLMDRFVSKHMYDVIKTNRTTGNRNVYLKDGSIFKFVGEMSNHSAVRHINCWNSMDEETFVKEYLHEQ